MDQLVQKAKALLPLPQLIVKLGDANLSDRQMTRGDLIRSPLREDNNPSFSFYNRGGVWRWTDHGTGDGGDEIDYLARRHSLNNRDARSLFLETAGVQGRDEPAPKVQKKSKGITFTAGEPRGEAPTKPETKAPKIVQTPTALSWDRIRGALGEPEIEAIAQWRGYSPEFVAWARDRDWLGWYRGGPALPVHDEAGKLAGIHHRLIDDPNSWRNTAGGQSPMILGDPSKAEMLVLCESQWDAFAALEAVRAHTNPVMLDRMIAFVVSRGASNAKSLADLVKTASEAGKRIAAIEQNDSPRPDGKPTGNDQWTDAVKRLARGICFSAPPKDFEDVNAWWKGGMTGVDFLTTVESGQPKRTTSLSLRNAEELWTMQFDDSDNYIGDRMMAAGSLCSFIGPGGIGKSRIVLQMAACCILGREFLGLVTRARDKKWLFLQTENNNRRLHSDLKNLVSGMGLNEAERKALFRRLDFHTVEHDEDGFINMEDLESAQNVEAAIFDSNPDIVVVDPLNTFTSEDLNSDRPMAAVITKLVRAIKKGNPNRVPLIIHHSITGRAGAQKAVGWDKSSYGRNSKVLYGRVRSQWNLGKVDPDDESRLVLACGKNNDGKPFDEIGILVESNPTFYVIDQDHDPEAYRESIGAESGKKRGHTIDAEKVILDLIPQSRMIEKKELIEQATRSGVGENKARNALSRLLDRDEPEIFEHQIRRSGTRPKVMIARWSDELISEEPTEDNP